MIELYLLVYVLVHAAVISANIYVGFPLDQQYPNVARVGEAYSFSMANITYKSDDGTVGYSVGGLPTWLSFESNSRTFSGTPDKTDVGTFQITLNGTDSSDGSTISRNYSMMVSEEPGIELSSDGIILSELSEYGRTNGARGLVVTPGSYLNVSFSDETFKAVNGSDNAIKAYYGLSSDRSPLPNWVSFDSDTLTFKGRVPNVVSQVAPSYEYSFSFIATDYLGFAGAEGIFEVVLGAHELSTTVNKTIKINGTLGEDFDEEVPILSMVYLDDSLISKENLSSVTPESLPDFIDFNESNYSLSGTFPNTSVSDNFTITVEDIYGNSVELPYSFSAIDSIFTVDSLNDVNATRGDFFQYELLSSLFTDYENTKLNVSYNAQWLDFNVDNNTFTGEVPNNFDDTEVEVEATAQHDSESRKFYIRGVDATKTKSSSSSSSSSSSASSSTSSTSTSVASNPSSTIKAKSSSKGVNKKALAIGLGVGIPVFLIAVGLIIFLLCWKRSKKRSDEESKSKSTFPVVGGPSGGVIESDSSSTSKDIARANALMLDKKENGAADSKSTSSSITHVQSDSDESKYFDAEDKVQNSWRAQNLSDKANVLGGDMNRMRDSTGTMSTVNTDKLFSVRIVEDNSLRDSTRSSFTSSKYLSKNLTAFRDDSANFQRLDSDGNIIPVDQSNSQEFRKSYSSYLNVLPEELRNNEVNEHEDDKDAIRDNSSAFSTDTSSMNLLARFDNPKYDSFPDSKDIINSTQKSTTSHNQNHTVRTSQHSQASPSKITRFSAFHDSSSSILLDKDAKLVDFTRKSSMRDSSFKPDFHYEGESAQIQDNTSI